MKPFRFCAAFLMIIMTAGSLYAVNLSWDIPEKERLEIVRTARVKFYVNAQLLKTYDERNVINLTCYEKSGEWSRVKGVFAVYQRNSSKEVFEAGTLLEKHDADFAINTKGRFQVKETDYMPNLRHVPTLPAGEVKVGDTWTGGGELHFKNFSQPYKIPFTATYKLAEMKQEDGNDIAVIEYKYHFDKKEEGPAGPSDLPARVAASNKGTIFWDVTHKQPLEMTDDYLIVFIFNKPGPWGPKMGQEFHMNIFTKFKYYKAVTEEEKDMAAEELSKGIPKDSGIKVDKDDRGLVLRLGDVLFDFDSHALKEESKSGLNAVIDVIKKKYPDNELLVEGHTDSTGGTEYNQKLSVNRSLTVAQYLKNLIGHDKISYQGFGAAKPISDNATAEGRKINRRVEIIIKLQ